MNVLLEQVLHRLANEEGSRELDMAVAQCLGWTLWQSKHGYWTFDGPNGERVNTAGEYQESPFDPQTGKRNPLHGIPPLGTLADHANLPNWTTSLADAKSLIPENWGWELYYDGSGSVFKDVPPNRAPEHPEATKLDFEGYEPEHGLVIGALKARDLDSRK